MNLRDISVKINGTLMIELAIALKEVKLLTDRVNKLEYIIGKVKSTCNEQIKNRYDYIQTCTCKEIKELILKLERYYD